MTYYGMLYEVCFNVDICLVTSLKYKPQKLIAFQMNVLELLENVCHQNSKVGTDIDEEEKNPCTTLFLTFDQLRFKRLYKKAYAG